MSNGRTTTVYSAANVIATYGGHTMRGFAGGDDVIQVTRREDAVDLSIGVQGDGVFSQSTDMSGTITITLQAGSATNEFLSGKARAGELGALFVAPLVITEIGTDTKTTADKCVIQKVPDLSRGATAGEVEWVFLSPFVRTYQAGSEEI